MSQSGKLMPNLDQNSTKVLNLTVLQRMDPYIEEILITAAHVTFYEFNVELNQWSRKDVEGSLFVVKRNTQPRFQFIVMNRRNTGTLSVIYYLVGFCFYWMTVSDSLFMRFLCVSLWMKAESGSLGILDVYATIILLEFALPVFRSQLRNRLFAYAMTAECSDDNLSVKTLRLLMIENLVENLLGDFEFELQVPYLLYRNASQEVNGIWFYNSRESEDVANLFTRYLFLFSFLCVTLHLFLVDTRCIFKGSPEFQSEQKVGGITLCWKPSRVCNKEAVPTSAVTEPPFTTPSSIDVPDDSSFVNFFSTLGECWNAQRCFLLGCLFLLLGMANLKMLLDGKSAINLGHTSSIPFSSVKPYHNSTMASPATPSPLLNGPTMQIPSLAPSTPAMPLRVDPESVNSSNLVTNLFKPLSFFTPSSSLSPTMPQPISSIPVTALQPPLNIQRSHGVPLLQPFPPPTPPLSLTPNSTSPPNYGPLGREKVRDALMLLAQDNQFIDMLYQALLKANQKS
ncbi:Dcp1-like decapping [Cynara cardunculus var. scolymus]|uniref:Dcp1-like decapping n=1 Tax=Cynara cardunculus var. scolymus TaxID=59895 RepID=A0A103YFU7_CYNCS|nr:Dcp1-like decapping [Cynara cardunculus var. scolymus]